MVKRARVKKREPEKPQEEEAPAEENGEEEESGKRRWLRRKAKSDVEDESEDGRSRLDALKESLNQPLFEKIPLTRKKLLVIIGGMMVLSIIGSIASSVLFGGNETPPNPTPIENQEPVDEPDPSLNTIQVIQVKQDLIPGDVITEDVIQSATISAESYNQITLGGTNIYQYNRASSLIGKYATAYIPTGQYLAYNNVASAYTPPKNPWVNEQQGKVYVTAPLDDETATSVLLNFGAKVDMTIKKETVRQTEALDDSPDIPGMTHQTTIYQSVSIDTYEMQNVIVCDKAPGKAMTYADKYALMKTYKISTGIANDPDSIPSPDEGVAFVETNPLIPSSKNNPMIPATSPAASTPVTQPTQAPAKAVANTQMSLDAARQVIVPFGNYAKKTLGELMTIDRSLVEFYASDRFSRRDTYPQLHEAAQVITQSKAG